MEVVLSIPDTKMRKTDPAKRKELYEKRREKILADMKEKYWQDPFKLRARHAAYYHANKERIKANRAERIKRGLIPGRGKLFNKSSAPRDFIPRKPETVETVRASPLLFKEASFSVSFD
jgi:hypothetical protein